MSSAIPLPSNGPGEVPSAVACAIESNLDAPRSNVEPEAEIDLFYRSILETGPPIYWADRTGLLRQTSNSFRELARELGDRSAIDLLELLAVPQTLAELEHRNEVIRDHVLAGMPRRGLTIRHRALRGPAGELVGVCGTLEEITETGRLARELTVAQERLDDITRLVSDWVWEIDADMVLSFVSPRIGEMLDFHPRELIKRRFTDFGKFAEGPAFVVDDGSHQPFRDILYRAQSRSGGWRLFSLSGLPVFSAASGEFLGYRGTARDITKETDAWERVEQSHDRLIEAIESISEGFALFDPDERLVLCNSKYRSMFAASAELLQTGIRMDDFLRAAAERGDVLLSGTTAQEWCAEQRTMRQRGQGSFEMPLSDGRWVKVADRIAANGSRVAILTDITETKRREEALSAAKEFAEIASRSKSEFLANISHELRTPLNAIIGFTEIMRDEIFGAIGSRQYKDYLGDILDSARHLLDVINDILDVAKAEAGKLELDEDDVEIAAVVRAAARLVQERAHRTELTLAILIPAGLPIVYADERKLKQILLNLLTNAIKFTPPGGKVDVVAEVEPAGDFLLRVIDTGIGIAPEHIATALTPFGQVDGGLTRKYEGTGLGLPLTRAMVELHGGSLSIASREREGTTVSVRLPASRVRRQFDYGI